MVLQVAIWSHPISYWGWIHCSLPSYLWHHSYEGSSSWSCLHHKNWLSATPLLTQPSLRITMAVMNLQIHLLSALGHAILASNITIFATIKLNTTSPFNLQFPSQSEGVLVLSTLSYVHTRIALFIGRFFFYGMPKPHRAVCCSLLCQLCDFLDCTSL